MLINIIDKILESIERNEMEIQRAIKEGILVLKTDIMAKREEFYFKLYKNLKENKLKK